MNQQVQQHNYGYTNGQGAAVPGTEKELAPYHGKVSSAPTYPDEHEPQSGEVYDPYGGKKLGMVR